MTWRQYLLLSLLGLALLGVVSAFQSAPGYMDADYYYAGGLQLAQGRGFSEPYLWNYLDDPAGLPHPSHAYWMPLASMMTALGAAIFGAGSWTAGRMGFLLVGAAVAPLTAALAWRVTARLDLAWLSGLLAVFPGFYVVFLPVTDTFGLYMLLGGIFVLTLTYLYSPSSKIRTAYLAAILGCTAGLMHLTRADGLLWLLLALVAILIGRTRDHPWRTSLISFTAVFGGYLLVTAPWLVRNALAFGSPLGAGGARMLWLKSYDELFAYPASRLTFAAWWQSGLASILKARVWALGINLQRTLAEQGEIFLLPFIAVGWWILRRQKAIQVAGLGWLLTLAAMTVAFPFAGARGGYFHSGAALQPFWWALAPLGFSRSIEWISLKRGWKAERAQRLFQPALVALAVLLSAGIFWGRLIGPRGPSQTPSVSSLVASAASVHARDDLWSQENALYRQIGEYLSEQAIPENEIVIAANPPGFYLASSHPTIAVPDGDQLTLLDVARRYGASVLVLENASTPVGLRSLYDHPETSTDPVFLGEAAGAHIYRFLQH